MVSVYVNSEVESMSVHAPPTGYCCKFGIFDACELNGGVERHSNLTLQHSPIEGDTKFIVFRMFEGFERLSPLHPEAVLI
jgi:hypothetical protein